MPEMIPELKFQQISRWESTLSILKSIYTTGPQTGKWARYQLITSIDWQHIPTRVKVTSDFLTRQKSAEMSFYSVDLLTRPLVGDIDRLVEFSPANKCPNVPILVH